MNRRSALPLLTLLLTLPGCSGSDTEAARSESGPGTTSASEGELDRELRDLMSAVSPLPPDSTVFQEHDWYGRRKETLARLRGGPPRLGEKALQAFEVRTDALRDVRAALLDVAAHCSPEETRAVLVELVTTFGHDPSLRKNAAHLLAQTSPEEAVTVIGPIIATVDHNATYPPSDALLESWLLAMETLGRDPSPTLASAATDIRRDVATRNFAIKALGRRPSDLGRQALEQVLVESLGNQLARRFAAQSLRATLDEDELCPVIQRVFDNESDVMFQQFLASMLEEVCL